MSDCMSDLPEYEVGREGQKVSMEKCQHVKGYAVA